VKEKQEKRKERGETEVGTDFIRMPVNERNVKGLSRS